MEPKKEKKPAAAAAADVSAENAQAAVESNEKVSKTVLKCAILVGCYVGTEEIIKKIFSRAQLPEGCEIIFISSENEDKDVSSSLGLAAYAASTLESQPEELILIPAGTIPCDLLHNRLDMAALKLPTVYILQGKEVYNNRLPAYFKGTKAELLEVLGSVPDEMELEDAAEEFSKQLIKHMGLTAVQVGYTFGNHVTPVNRGNPCDSVVIAGLLQKKFITSIPEGFQAITPLLKEAFAK